MKKILTYMYIILLIVIVYILQIYLIDSRTLLGVKPNLILISVVAVSLWYDLYKGAIFSFIIGLLTDIIYGTTNGEFTICYSITGVLIAFLNYNYRKENKMALLYVTVIATGIFELCQYVFYIFNTSDFINIFTIIKQILLASILNICITYIIYGLLYKITERIEDSLNDKTSYGSLR